RPDRRRFPRWSPRHRWWRSRPRQKESEHECCLRSHHGASLLWWWDLRTNAGPRTPAGSRRSSGSGCWMPEIDGPAPPAAQLGHQVVHAPEVGVELSRHDADEAHEVRVAPPEAGVPVLPHELLDTGVLALLAAAVQRLDGDHPVERPLALVVGAQADVRTS